MKGPGLRIDVDVRRAWLCPVCGQGQRLTMDITAPRCLCVRDGVPMKLAEGQRPGRLSLRPELRSMLDRIQGGEEFPRMSSPLTSDSEGAPREGGSGGYGGSKSRNRPPRPERSGGDADQPPREPRPSERQLTSQEGEAPAEPQVVANAEIVAAPIASSMPPQEPVAPPPRPPVTQADDDFGAGLSTDNA